ncbi:MAE_28990/MAE_18760 family HEPN-like nuclease [Actinobacillus vicugnae]|uniref:MAE_28990/MAE_18760 family HEPN-like nuclease n=1 Tax=Actinobacillus vicugnae TaxID=2573093 RepID=UPI001241781B|nr:MAE_28990/MAE_18760 family HEPN-like nuclease [Actinobacillus vicugnae]
MNFIPETTALFLDKKKEVEDFISFLKKLASRDTKIKYKVETNRFEDLFFEPQSNTTFPDNQILPITIKEDNVSNELMHTLKSSGILLLYSLSEAIVSTLMREIHEHFKNKLESNQLNVRKINEKLMTRIIEHHKSSNKMAGYIIQHINRPRVRSIEKILFQEWLEFYRKKVEDEDKSPWFSGNVDNRSIKELGEIYGFYQIAESTIFTRQQCNTLVRVKKGRNQLAHGKKSFIDYGADLAVDDLETFSLDIFTYLENLMRLINDYLANQNYINCR